MQCSAKSQDSFSIELFSLCTSGQCPRRANYDCDTSHFLFLKSFSKFSLYPYVEDIVFSICIVLQLNLNYLYHTYTTNMNSMTTLSYLILYFLYLVVCSHYAPTIHCRQNLCRFQNFVYKEEHHQGNSH